MPRSTFTLPCPVCGAQLAVELEDDTAQVDGELVSFRGFGNCPACGESRYGTYTARLPLDPSGFEFDEG